MNPKQPASLRRLQEETRPLVGPGGVIRPKARPSADVLIVGGGVVGCAIAYALSKRKLRVMLLEQGQIGSGASQAAAGMLAPLSDSYEQPAVGELAMRSFRLYPTFLKEAEEAADISAECMPTGVLRVARTAEEERHLRGQLPWATQHKVALEWVEPRLAVGLEPNLVPDFVGATFSPTEHQLNPSRLVEVLRRAAVAQGAEVREQTPVLGLIRPNGKVTGVRTASEEISAGTIVIATGAWAGLHADWLGLNLPIAPVRGQVAYLNKLARPLRHTVMHGDTYAVPKSDGMTLVGTTLEMEAGYDQRATVAGVVGFLTRIQSLLPTVGSASLNHVRAGLRPAATDGLPVLGPAPAAKNVILALGHYRSGILLSAVTAEMLAGHLLGSPVDFGPFAAGRLRRD